MSTVSPPAVAALARRRLASVIAIGSHNHVAHFSRKLEAL